MTARGDTTYQMDVLVAEHCGNCGILFGLPKRFKSNRTADGQKFYCPNGCQITYAVENWRDEALRRRHEADQLEARVRDLRAENVRVTRLKERHQKEKANLKRRVAHGVCAFCNRTFQDVAAHVERKHPEQRARSSG